jgi:hypothetical protein
MVAGKSGVGNKWERGREIRIKGLRDKSVGKDKKWHALEMTVGNDT